MPQVVPAVAATASWLASGSILATTVQTALVVAASEVAYDEPPVFAALREATGVTKRAIDLHLAQLVVPIRAPYRHGPSIQRTTAVGECLRPLVNAGDTLVVDVGRRAIHGDLVAVEWTDEAYEEVRRQDALLGERSISRDGAEYPRQAIKGFLVYEDGSAVLINRAGGIPLDWCRLVGTVVSVLPA